MGLLNRFRSPEERERRERERIERDIERARQEAERLERRLAEEKAEAERRAAQEEARSRAYAAEVLGDELAAMEINSAAEAKIAVKLLRIRKKELQAEKRQLSAQLADHREAWRERQAGRISTVGLGRGTGGRIIRSGIQAKRRGDRLQHAGVVNAYSDAKQVIDQKIAYVDRVILHYERMSLR